MTTASQQQITAEQLLRMPDVGRRELIAGRLKMMTPAGHQHGWITFRLSLLVGNHVLGRNLGRVYAAETGFCLARNPDTVRAPDVGFVRADRLVKEEGGFFPGAPDLAVEVVSGGDRVREVEEKVKAWLQAGTRAVWVVWPTTRTISVHLPDSKPVTLGEDDTLDGGDVLPGFACRVGEVFADR